MFKNLYSRLVIGTTILFQRGRITKYTHKGTVLGERVVLDHSNTKDVIFKDCFIIYCGGPLTMDSPTFEDCEFSFQGAAHGALQMQAILIGSNTLTPDNFIKLVLTGRTIQNG